MVKVGLLEAEKRLHGMLQETCWLLGEQFFYLSLKLGLLFLARRYILSLHYDGGKEEDLNKLNLTQDWLNRQTLLHSPGTVRSSSFVQSKSL